MSFEQSLTRLDEIVKQLESGTAPLEQSMKLYEEGIALVRFCSGELEIWLRKIGESSVANKVSGIPHNASSLQKLYKVFGLNPVHTEEEIRRLF